MTENDATIQDLKREVKALRRALQNVVESERLCRYCEYLDADCFPFSDDCKPVFKVVLK